MIKTKLFLLGFATYLNPKTNFTIVVKNSFNKILGERDFLIT